LNGTNVAFQDINPTHYIDLSRVVRKIIPKAFCGRTGVDAVWIDNDTVGLEVEARNMDENDTWNIKAIFSIGDRRLRKVDYLSKPKS
jgi:hypothetical protein